MDTIGHRIRKRREELGMSQEELGRKLGYKSRSSINKIELDQRNLTQSKIAALAKALNTTPAYIMGWEDEFPDQTSAINIKNILPLPQTKKVPLLGDIACGVPILAVENVAEYVDMDTDIHADFALRCNGDSMINARIFDGDIVYIRQQPEVENGEIAAVLIGTMDTEATLKRVYRNEDSLRLCAENPAYKDIVFFQEEINSIRILGKAVAFLSTVR